MRRVDHILVATAVRYGVAQPVAARQQPGSGHGGLGPARAPGRATTRPGLARRPPPPTRHQPRQPAARSGTETSTPTCSCTCAVIYSAIGLNRGRTILLDCISNSAYSLVFYIGVRFKRKKVVKHVRQDLDLQYIRKTKMNIVLV